MSQQLLMGPSVCEFTVPARIIPYARLRRSKHGGVFLPQDLMNQMHFIRNLAERACNGVPYSVPVAVYIDFFFATRNHGDIDNLVKTILDSLQPQVQHRRTKLRSGGMVTDDRLVKRLNAAVHQGEPERAEVRVEVLGGV